MKMEAVIIPFVYTFLDILIGAFLIPYLTCSFLIGFPLLYLELTLGQYARCGPAVIYGRIRPFFQGTGGGQKSSPRNKSPRFFVKLFTVYLPLENILFLGENFRLLGEDFLPPV
jgi:hypothetical protein